MSSTQAPKLILIVEDDLLAASAIRAPLDEMGYSVHAVHNGEAALEWLQANAPALVVLDAKMHGLSGYHLHRWMRGRAATSRTPIILLADWIDAPDPLAGRAVGADIYVSRRSLTKGRLASTVAKLLDAKTPAFDGSLS
jgi:DNA-binding response OmpR family regulator